MDRYVEEETQPKADYIRDFVIGAIAITIGGGITAATYASADPGGTYLVFWGPVLRRLSRGGWAGEMAGEPGPLASPIRLAACVA
jgi:hypothetical protein